MGAQPYFRIGDERDMDVERMRAIAAAAATQATPSEAPIAATLDPTALNSIAELDPGGEKGLVKRITTLFVEDSARLLEALVTALDAGDVEVARRSAHTLKSTAANVGGMALAQAAAATEQSLQGGDLAGAREARDRLRALQETVVAELANLKQGVAA